MDPLDELRRQRIEKLEKLESLGVNPYAHAFDRTHSAAEVLGAFEPDGAASLTVAVAGRLVSLRRMGKASFAHIADASGRIQVYFAQDRLGEAGYAVFRLLDLGDFIGVKGEVFRTRTGETTIQAAELTLLSKSLRPLPIVKEKIEGDEKTVYDAFADKETRYRQRYADLAVNPDVRRTFVLRSRIVSEMRRYLEGRGYLEVETPALQPQYGGAFARPFTTHHHALDMPLYLRIADELYLKRLLVGGFEGVFEIAKDFRNEGMDRDHNPEFTMMELYVAYRDYGFMQSLVEDMVHSVCLNVLGAGTVSHQGTELRFEPPWERIPFFEAIRRRTGEDCSGMDIPALKALAAGLRLQIEGSPGRGKWLDEIFSQTVQPHLVQPTFITDYPIELSPLAKKHRSSPGLVERFEGFVAGRELCNAFSELNDPLDQRRRFQEQAGLRAAGDEEAMLLDEDFLRALEYGMPPTAGLGIGVDRLTMLLTDAPTIRDVILFPAMRPERSA
ncbi:MAG: lysine--tRNA ligase [bacterium]|nr:lysine--tRNA ligase [bacterium]